MLTSEVGNFPGFPEGIMGPELLARMREQAKRFGTEILEENVISVDFKNRPYTICIKDKCFEAEAVILATGASTKWLDILGERRLIGRGVSLCATYDADFL